MRSTLLVYCAALCLLLGSASIAPPLDEVVPCAPARRSRAPLEGAQGGRRCSPAYACDGAPPGFSAQMRLIVAFRTGGVPRHAHARHLLTLAVPGCTLLLLLLLPPPPPPNPWSLHWHSTTTSLTSGTEMCARTWSRSSRARRLAVCPPPARAPSSAGPAYASRQRACVHARASNAAGQCAAALGGCKRPRPPTHAHADTHTHTHSRTHSTTRMYTGAWQHVCKASVSVSCNGLVHMVEMSRQVCVCVSVCVSVRCDICVRMYDRMQLHT